MSPDAAASASRTPGRPTGFDLAQFLFNAAGRSGRTAFLAAMFGLFVLSLAVSFGLERAPGPVHAGGVWLLGFVVFVVAGVVTSRRLHDLGLAGWWYAPVAGLEYLGETFSKGPSWAFWLVCAPWSLACLALLFWPGQRRLNRFGPPPVGIA